MQVALYIVYMHVWVLYLYYSNHCIPPCEDMRVWLEILGPGLQLAQGKSGAIKSCNC